MNENKLKRKQKVTIRSLVKKKHSQVSLQVLDLESGAYENRTHDLLTASKAETYCLDF